jgi:hypothetical protein
MATTVSRLVLVAALTFIVSGLTSASEPSPPPFDLAHLPTHPNRGRLCQP